MKLERVTTLYESNARQPIEMARKLADDLESGKYGVVRSVTAVIECDNGSVEVFGWGDLGLLRSVGMLTIGINKLSAMRNNE